MQLSETWKLPRYSSPQNRSWRPNGALDGGVTPQQLYPQGRENGTFRQEAVQAQGLYGQVQKISPPPGFDPRTVRPIASHWGNGINFRSIKVQEFILDTRHPAVYMKNCFYQGKSPKRPIYQTSGILVPAIKLHVSTHTGSSPAHTYKNMETGFIKIIINYIFFSLMWDLKPYIVFRTICQLHQIH
jgi:hypothetical protein